MKKSRGRVKEEYFDFLPCCLGEKRKREIVCV